MEIMTLLKFSLHIWTREWIISDYFSEAWKMTSPLPPMKWKFLFILYFFYLDGFPVASGEFSARHFWIHIRSCCFPMGPVEFSVWHMWGHIRSFWFPMGPVEFSAGHLWGHMRSYWYMVWIMKWSTRYTQTINTFLSTMFLHHFNSEHK